MSKNDFADINPQEVAGNGLFAGSGLNAHYRVEAKPRSERDGYQVNAACDNCGQGTALVFDWQEIAHIANGVLPNPQEWEIRSGRIVPVVGCRGCGRPLSLGTTPDEAVKWLSAGVKGGLIPLQQAQALDAQAKQIKAQRGR